MKPLVYFDFEEYDGDKNLVLVSKERLQEILNEVYNAGYLDGSNNRTYITTTPTYPNNWRDNIVYCGDKQQRDINSTGSPLTNPNIVVTCSSDKNNIE